MWTSPSTCRPPAQLRSDAASSSAHFDTWKLPDCFQKGPFLSQHVYLPLLLFTPPALTLEPSIRHLRDEVEHRLRACAAEF